MSGTWSDNLPDFLVRMLSGGVQNGGISLQFAWSDTMLMAAGAGLTLLAVVYAIRETRRRGARAGTVLLISRSLLFWSLLWMISEPRLRISTEESVPLDTAIVVDASASMNLEAESGTSRGAHVIQTLKAWFAQHVAADEAATDAAVPAVPRGLHLFTTATTSQAQPHLDAVTFDAARTSLTPILEQLQQRRHGLRLGTIVLASDGGFVLTTADRRALQRLRGAGIAVHTLGVGPRQIGRDVEVVELRVPASAVTGSRIQVEARVRQQGYTGQSAEVRLEVDGLVVGRQQVTFEAENTQVFEYLPENSGVASLEVVVEVMEGESNRFNNSDTRLLHTADRTIRVLHVEGEPRFEVKFLRRAVAADPNISLVSLIRTAENKFYRLGVRDAEELRDGFPVRAEDLFGFDVMVYGSVPANMLTPEQHELVKAFAARRGGGVMFLGGRFAFAEGDHQRSPIAQMLPFVLNDSIKPANLQLAVQLTSAGTIHDVARLAMGSATTLPVSQLPLLTSVNASVGGIAQLKPGASVLWLGQPTTDALPRLLLTEQRFGRGRVAALAARDLWRWQMDSRVPLADETLEVFWQQWLRRLAREADGVVSAEADKRIAAPGEPVTIRGHVFDNAFHPADATTATLVVITPDGKRESLPVDTDSATGVVQANFIPTGPGLYEFELQAVRAGGTQTYSAAAFTQVQELGREMFSGPRNDDTLTQIAALGGGRYWLPEDLEALTQHLNGQRHAQVRVTWREVWNWWPVVLLLFLAMLGEWVARRRWRLP